MKIIASHQPNFLPYMGFIYKMYMCDIFTLSDDVQFSRGAFHNYNFFSEQGEKVKITVPVKKHTGKIRDVELSEWRYNRSKIIKRIEAAYKGYPFYDKVWPGIKDVLMNDFVYMSDLNTELLVHLKEKFRMECKIINESLLFIIKDEPTREIIQIVKACKGDAYLSGDGAREYMKIDAFDFYNVDVLWTKFNGISYGSQHENLSVLDYIMTKGYEIPVEWINERRMLHA